MRDMKAHQEKRRVQVCECELIRDLTTDAAKRELFNRLAEHLRVLASEIERALLLCPSDKGAESVQAVG
jgi:hypothetical protein